MTWRKRFKYPDDLLNGGKLQCSYGWQRITADGAGSGDCFLHLHQHCITHIVLKL